MECRASDCPLNAANRQEPAVNCYGRTLDQVINAQTPGFADHAPRY